LAIALDNMVSPWSSILSVFKRSYSKKVIESSPSNIQFSAS
jgi:hypothetical protein